RCRLNDLHRLHAAFLPNFHFVMNDKPGNFACIGVAADKRMTAGIDQHFVEANHVLIRALPSIVHRSWRIDAPACDVLLLKEVRRIVSSETWPLERSARSQPAFTISGVKLLPS